MPLSAKVRSLRARASQSADLSFNMAGVIAGRNYDFTTDHGSAHLGKAVRQFDMRAQLYAHLGDTLPEGGSAVSGAQLRFGSSAISQLLTSEAGGRPAPYLFSLRNETLAAALDQALLKRENAFLERYKYVIQIVDRLRASSPAITDHLRQLLAKSEERFRVLDTEYKKDSVEVRKATSSQQSVSGDYAVVTQNTTHSTTLATWNSAMPLDEPMRSEIVTQINDANGAKVQTHGMENSASLPRILNEAGKWELVNTPDFVSQRGDSRTTSSGMQVTETPDPRYTHPRLDNEIEYRQMSQAVHGELIKQDLASQRLPHLERILENELQAIDFEIRSLQLNFAHTYLTAPFDGVVTALYKDIGESIEAGEPILRLENDAILLIIGQVQAAGVVRLGAAVRIEFDDKETGVQRQLIGRVVSVRGHEADDDEWDIIVQADNPVLAGGSRLVPLNYHFDSDSTQLSFT